MCVLCVVCCVLCVCVCVCVCVCAWLPDRENTLHSVTSVIGGATLQPSVRSSYSNWRVNDYAVNGVVLLTEQLWRDE